MSHEYRMEQLRAAIAAARKNFKKDANFFVVGLTYGWHTVCISFIRTLLEFVIVPAGTKAKISDDIHTAVLCQHHCTEASGFLNQLLCIIVLVQGNRKLSGR